MTYLLAIVAGAIQGLTEFLPVSSTGHLIIFEKITGIPQEQFGLTFDASLHLGTLLAVVIFFFKDYLRILDRRERLLAKLAVGTLPAVIVGLIFENLIETTLRQISVVAFSLIFFSLVLVLAEKIGAMTRKRQDLNLRDALFVGFFQALALIPGISRSGATIAGGIFAGLNRQESARFAFMLSGPVIAAAGFAKFVGAIQISNGVVNLNFFIIGIISSFIFGILTIKYFLAYLSSQTLYPFIVYRIIIGLLLLFFLI